MKTTVMIKSIVYIYLNINVSFLLLRVFFKNRAINVAFKNNEWKNGVFQTASHSQQSRIKVISIDYTRYNSCGFKIWNI